LLLSGLLATSRFVGEALALGSRDAASSALFVVDAELSPVVPAEIELREVTVEVLGVHLLVDADHAALEDREEAFDGVGVDIAPDVFLLGVNDDLVAGSLGRVLEAHGTVRDQARALAEVLVEDASGALGVHGQRAGDTVAINEAEDALVAALAVRALLGVMGIGNEGLVNLDGRAFAANRAGAGSRGHGFTDAMAEKPGGLHADAQGPLKLAGRNAFLGRAKQVDRLKPEMQGAMTGLEDRAHAHGERLAP